MTINKSLCKIFFGLIAFCGVHSLVANAGTGYYNCQAHYCCNPSVSNCNKNGWPTIQLLSAPATLATTANPAPQGYSGTMDAYRSQTTFNVTCYGKDTPATVIFKNVSLHVSATNATANSIWGNGVYSYHSVSHIIFKNLAWDGKRSVLLAMVTCNKPTS